MRFSYMATLGFALFALGTLAGPASANFTINFDTLSNEPPRSGNESLFYATGGSPDAGGGPSVVDGVSFDGYLYVVGDQFIGDDHLGTDPYAVPHSGHYALFNSQGQSPVSLSTDKTLLGAYFGRNDYGDGSFGADSVTVSALSGSTVLASDTLRLTSITPTYLDTSGFSALVGVTGYRITRTVSNGSPGHYIADDFTFSGTPAVPEAATTFSFGLLLALGVGGMVIAMKKTTTA